ncbi:Hypothetical protein PHPALM_3144 [Phytophthora palmivora]|uniref:Uncharacterized protein n=1 Tax=Phytophthora palmivora TaxID=4796 RepID=A0A2P4YN59_9STRA|nr:Hypothetical protein PHPALM_3144 [Phytophthora palmivora]
MQISRREKPAAPAATAHDVDFSHLRRQLRSVGRVQEDSCDLAISQNHFATWVYSSPDDSNVFVGENAVVEYTFHSGRLVIGDSDEAVKAAKIGKFQWKPLVMAIGNSVLLSKNRIEQILGCSTASETAVAKAFNLSSSDLQATDDEQKAAASLQMLSGASELGSEG